MRDRDAPSTVIQVGDRGMGPRGWLIILGLGVIGAAVAGGVGLYYGLRHNGPTVPAFSSSEIELKPTPSILTEVRALQRLQTTEVQVEKVVDVTDDQKKLWGLVDEKDNMLLVAHGKAQVGIDLDKVKDSDITFDKESGVAHFRLPAPEVFSVSLDEDKTYVYKRDTDLLADRNEHLESRARKEASTAIEAAAHQPEVMNRAKDSAESTLSNLAKRLGAKKVDFEWR